MNKANVQRRTKSGARYTYVALQKDVDEWLAARGKENCRNVAQEINYQILKIMRGEEGVGKDG